MKVWVVVAPGEAYESSDEAIAVCATKAIAERVLGEDQGAYAKNGVTLRVEEWDVVTE